MLFGFFITITTIFFILLLSLIILFGYRFYKNWKIINDNKVAHSDETVVDNISQNSQDVNVSSNDKSSEPFSFLKTRFRAIGIFVIGCFSILTIKIFSMQVLSGDFYAQKSNANATTTIKTTAPRGLIYDSDGNVLVKNKSTQTVLAESYVASDDDTIKRLSVVLGVPRNIIKSRIQNESNVAQSRRVIASDITKKQSAYILEHLSAFPGITCESRMVRTYPYGALGAHFLGYSGSVSQTELDQVNEGRDIQAEDNIGKTGIEASYDNFLAGDHGERVVVNDANGNIVSEKSKIEPTKGSDVYLTIKAPVQYLSDKLLSELIAPKGIIGQGIGTAGSVVVMNIEDGSIIAMSNYPTFNPTIFSNGISQDIWNQFNTSSSHYPLLNRAIAGTYPAASTFKAFSGAAGLKYGFAGNNSSWYCSGTWTGFGEAFAQKCWLSSGHGHIGFRDGIVKSCDVVFYEIGKQFFNHKDTIGENAMQDVISSFNFGKATGIDINGEELGRIPTPEWKREYFKDVPTESSWLGGDYANMAIGQGYVLITPIQLAVGYGSIATGKLVKPHLLKEIKNVDNISVVEHSTEHLGTPDVSKENLDIILDALHGVATDTLGSSFKSNNISGFAKTGTAEVSGQQDYSWAAVMGPYPKPKYVVTCIIEQGGWGSASSTPIATKVLAETLSCDVSSAGKQIGFIPGSSGSSVKYTNTSSGSRND